MNKTLDFANEEIYTLLPTKSEIGAKLNQINTIFYSYVKDKRPMDEETRGKLQSDCLEMISILTCIDIPRKSDYIEFLQVIVGLISANILDKPLPNAIDENNLFLWCKIHIILSEFERCNSLLSMQYQALSNLLQIAIEVEQNTSLKEEYQYIYSNIDNMRHDSTPETSALEFANESEKRAINVIECMIETITLKEISENDVNRETFDKYINMLKTSDSYAIIRYASVRDFQVKNECAVS